jgi:type I restriction enzyme S subunit
LGNYFITEEKFQELKNFKVRARDLLISCSGTIGKIVEVPMGIKEGVINQALLRIRLNGDVINQGYFLHIFQSDTFQKKIIDSTQGGAMKNLIGMNEFRNVLFTRPPLEEQNQIASILSSVDDKIEVLTQKKYHYQTLKKGLSQQLLTGQMRVKV